MKLNWPLLALAAGAFGIGTTEFAPMGLLPVIAKDLQVSIPTAGLLVSGYALGVLAGAPLLTLTTTRLPRKSVLIGLMLLFTIGNALSAIAPTYTLLLAARVVTSLCHGAFFGIGSVVAGKIAGPGKQAQAVAGMFMGLTIANIGGVPLATWAGQALGWRAAFGGIAGLGVLAIVALLLALPKVATSQPIEARKEIGVLRQRPVLLALLTTVLGSAAMFTVFTYIAPILQTVTRVPASTVTVALVVYGIGLTIGNWLGGRFADKALNATLVVVLASLTGLLLLFAYTMRFPVPAVATVFAWGIATFALVPSLQARVMSLASAAPNLVSAINIGAFNLGNAIGAAIGGGVIAAGFGYTWIAVAGAGMALSGLVVVRISNRTGPAPAADGPPPHTAASPRPRTP